jgi:iron complex outermembrane recepter protein
VADFNGDGVEEPAVPLPIYTLVDAGLSYQLNQWDARFELNNVFNKRYYPDANDLTRLTPSEPCNWRLSLSRKSEYQEFC